MYGAFPDNQGPQSFRSALRTPPVQHPPKVPPVPTCRTCILENQPGPRADASRHTSTSKQLATPLPLQPSRFRLAPSNARQRHQPLLSRPEDTHTGRCSEVLHPRSPYLRAQLTRISRRCEQNRRVFSNRPQIDLADRAGGPRKPGEFRHLIADYAVSQQEWDRFPKTVTCRRLSDISSAHLQEPPLPHKDEPLGVHLSVVSDVHPSTEVPTIGDREKAALQYGSP